MPHSSIAGVNNTFSGGFNEVDESYLDDVELKMGRVHPNTSATNKRVTS